jgi:mannose-6-phosphate isomerase-like protein (cupin superfamily)
MDNEVNQERRLGMGREQDYFFNLEEELKKHPLPEDTDLMLHFLKHAEYSAANLAQTRGGVKEHIHKDHDELIYILRGEHEFIVDGIARKVKPGDLIIVPAGIRHTVNVGPDYAALSIYAPDWDEDKPDRIYFE